VLHPEDPQQDIQFMSHCRKSAGLVSLVAAVSASAAAFAQVQFMPAGPGFFYVGGEAGWTSLFDAHASATIPVIGHRHDHESWDNGYAAGMRAGYEWGPWRLEEEFRYQRNSDQFLVTSGGRGHYIADALMANAIYDPLPTWFFSPHIGGGIGPVHLGSTLNVTGLEQVIVGGDWVFGYQAIAGLRFHLASFADLDVDYRYLATTTPQFRTGADFIDSGVHAPGVAVASGYRSQSVDVSISVPFGARPPTVP
jgi:opacity protein-like surface antigen